MQNSKAYGGLIKQLNVNGSEKMDGYYPEVMEEIYDWEREEVEDITKKILLRLRKRYHLFQLCHIASLGSDYMTCL